MLIDLRKLDDSEFEFDIRIKPPDVDLKSRFAKLKKSADFVGRVVKESWLSRVGGHFDAAIERRCDRCFKNAEMEISVDVDAAYVVYSALNEDREIKLDVLGLEYSVLENHTLDLKMVFAEQLLIALPDRFVCDAGCAGICATCGKPKDSGECKCKDESIDPRWAALSDLKKKS